MNKLTYTDTEPTKYTTIENAEIEFVECDMANFTEACRSLAYCAGFSPDTIDRYMVNPYDNSYIEEGD
jgi:hypothetical protein